MLRSVSILCLAALVPCAAMPPKMKSRALAGSRRMIHVDPEVEKDAAVKAARASEEKAQENLEKARAAVEAAEQALREARDRAEAAVGDGLR